MKLETQFTATLLKKLRAVPHSWWEKIQQVGKRGTPDILGCVKCGECGDAKFVAAEVKVGNNKPTDLQIHKLVMIKRAGGYGEIIHPGNYEDEIRRFEEWTQKKSGKR